MTYLDAHGRPELVMHPDVKRGTASVRVDRDGDHQPGDPGWDMVGDGRTQDRPSGAV